MYGGGGDGFGDGGASQFAGGGFMPSPVRPGGGDGANSGYSPANQRVRRLLGMENACAAILDHCGQMVHPGLLRSMADDLHN